jgi:protein-disulfide isomerase
MTRIISVRFAMLFSTIGMLAACGNVSGPGPQSAPSNGSGQTGAATAGSRPSASQPTAAPVRTAMPAATRSLPAQPVPTVAGTAIAQGVTPEGYHFLGRADAPATLVMYSDFL